MTPDFSLFGEKRECVVQMEIQGGDMTTTYVNYSFFLDTQPEKTLCYGPGILKDMSIHEPVEFIIQARNEHEENRTSGRDDFMVTVTTRPRNEDEQPKEIPCEIKDTNDGKYFVKYHVEEECDVDIMVKYQDGKGKWQTVRGAPYTASFNSTSDAKFNSLTGPMMLKNVQETIAETKSKFEKTSEGAKTGNKDLSDVKVLIGVKDCVEHVQTQAKPITLSLDQMYESL